MQKIVILGGYMMACSSHPRLSACGSSTKQEHPKSGIVLGFTRLVDAVEPLPNTMVWGHRGLWQAPHCAGVLHIPLPCQAAAVCSTQTRFPESISGIISASDLWATTALGAAVYLVCSSVRLNKKPETKQLSSFMEWDKENNRCFY